MDIADRVRAQPRDRLIVQNKHLKSAITMKLMKGMKVADAARAYGITRRTLWSWLDQAIALEEATIE